MNESEKDLILSDENHKWWKKFLCINQIKQQTIFIILVIILLIIVGLLAIFGIFTINELKSRNAFMAQSTSEFSCRTKRSISDENNLIKRETADYDEMEEFLGEKFHEVNKNFADDESDRNLHKRSNFMRNSIQELEATMEKSEKFLKEILNRPTDEETANLIEKDLRDVEDEINGLDDDIVSLLEISDLTDKSSRKRVRHKRDLFDNFDLNPIAISMYAPTIDEKKREKRLIQQKLAEVRDEFVRCKKSTGSTVPKSDDCEKVYHKVIDRFRQITKKFKEIEDIVNDMETLGSVQRKDSAENSKEKKDKKKDKKKKDKNKKSSESNSYENVISNSTNIPTHINSTLSPTSESNFASSPTTSSSLEPEAITKTTTHENVISEHTTSDTKTSPISSTEALTTTSTSTTSRPSTNFVSSTEGASASALKQTTETVTAKSTPTLSSSTQHPLIVQPAHLLEDETSTISVKLGNTHMFMRDDEKADESCPASKFQKEFPHSRQHHTIAEELSDNYRLGSKFYGENLKHDHVISDRMHMRVNPEIDINSEPSTDSSIPSDEVPFNPNHHKIVEELNDNFRIGSMYHAHPKHDHIISERTHERENPFIEALDTLRDRLETNMENQFDFTHPSVKQPQSEESTESEFVGAAHSGARETFTSLCENLSKNNNAKQAAPVQFIGDNPNLVPIQLSGFSNPMHFPPTTGEVKGSSKVVMNQGYSGIMPYPICFMQFAPAVRQMSYYPYPVGYPGMYPYPMPVMQTFPTQAGGNFHRIDPRIDNGYYVSAGGRPNVGVGSPQTYRDGEENNPTYCAFLPNSDTNFPNAYFEQTTAQPPTTSPKILNEEKNDETNRANSYNIPSQFDIIYATYPNQIFAMNQSAQHHHCDKENLPCFSTNQCIPKSKWCDSKVDCIDASDETACSCKARLDESRICDGFIDCPMGSDELGCFGCDKFQYSCYASQDEYEQSGYSSKSMCYSSTEKCDGFNHCKNGKDETECTMIVKNLGNVNSYLVSYSEGILHRNYKGRWYPVCQHASRWAMEACEAEVGKLNSKPQITIKSGQMSGLFIQPSLNRDNQQVDYEPSLKETCQLSRDAAPDENHFVYVKCDQPKCGTSKLSESHIRVSRDVDDKKETDVDLEATRIVGGVEAVPMEFPFIVAIYKDGRFHCGGSIYNEHWIITAAHCTRAFENHYYEIRAGILRRSSYSPSAHITKVTHIVRHEGYERATMKNDIALMRVKHHFNFNKWIRPICLPTKIRTGIKDWLYGPKAGTICTTLGWGAIRERGPDPDSLQVVEVPILSKCKYLNDREGESVCAGEKIGLKDACQGDSGGPLVCKSDNDPNEWYLTGIVSHGEGCARANEPGVYTRTALYLDWIATNVDKPLPATTPKQDCPGMVCVWGAAKCIAKASHCNGIVDCLGGEDEINCPLNWIDLMLSERSNDNENKTSPIDPNKVPEHVKGDKKPVKKDLGNHEVFRCTNISQVINIAQRCDRVFDCQDGSDEKNCTCKDHLKGKFSKLICDGHVDCADSTDEIDCVTCKPAEFLCPQSKTCIDRKKQCNGEPDCKFKEDELDCVALTDGHSISLDVNGKPFMHTKGIVTRNIESNWKVLCDDTGDFSRNGSEIANDICSLIGFKFAKSFNVIQISSSKVDSNSIARNQVMIKLVKEIDKSEIENCQALEIECSAVPSNTFAIHTINQEKNKNGTKVHSEIHFVPADPNDHKNIFVKPINTNSWDHLRDFEWPWNVEIFVDGEIVGNGILLDNSWILADKTILGSETEPLKTKHVTAMVGNSKHFINIQSPYEQVSKIDCIQIIKESNAALLHLKDRIHFNRHVLPSFLPSQSDSEPDSRCIAVALSSKKIIRSLELKVNAECPNDVHLSCYQVARNETVLCTDSETSHRVAAILCKKKSSSWFPKAFHRMNKGFCDFIHPVSVHTLSKGNAYEEIQKLIDSPCDKCTSTAEEIKCKTHRCPLGKCLKEDQLCNGIPDCRDGSDENKETCEKVKDDKKCAAHEFQCHSGQCVDKTKFCDHTHDCTDKSDEPSECTCFDFLRTTNPKKICDGIVHCWDRTDEDAIYCGGKCDGKFKCNNSTFCVPFELVCDKRNDCPNGADEMLCHGLVEKSADGFSEVVQRTMGLWHSKCYPKSSRPTQDDVDEMCKQLGFTEIKSPKAKLRGLADESKKEKPTSVPFVPIEFHSSNATKVILHSKFAPTKINDGFTVHLKTDKPLGKLVSWTKEDHENCYRLEIKCE